MVFMCAEKVERLCSMLCSSPMSARMPVKTLTALRSPAGNVQSALRHQAEETERFET